MRGSKIGTPQADRPLPADYAETLGFRGTGDGKISSLSEAKELDGFAYNPDHRI